MPFRKNTLRPYSEIHLKTHNISQIIISRFINKKYKNYIKN